MYDDYRDDSANIIGDNIMYGICVLVGNKDYLRTATWDERGIRIWTID